MDSYISFKTIGKLLDREGDIELDISSSSHTFTFTAIQAPKDNPEFYVDFMEVMDELGMQPSRYKPLEYTMNLDSTEQLYNIIQKLKSAIYNISYAGNLETKIFLQIGRAGAPRKYLTKQQRDQAFREREKDKKHEQQARIVELELEVSSLKQQYADLQSQVAELEQITRDHEIQREQIELAYWELLRETLEEERKEYNF